MTKRITDVRTSSNNVEGFAMLLDTTISDLDQHTWYLERVLRDLNYPAVFENKIENKAKELEEQYLLFLSTFTSLLSLLEQEERATLEAKKMLRGEDFLLNNSKEEEND